MGRLAGTKSGVKLRWIGGRYAGAFSAFLVNARPTDKGTVKASFAPSR